MRQSRPLQRHLQPLMRYGLNTNRTVLCEFDKGELLMSQGMPSSFFYFMLEGSVRVHSQTYGGDRVAYENFADVDYPTGLAVQTQAVDSPILYGSVELARGSLVSYNTVEAQERTLCVGLPWDDAVLQLSQSARFAAAICHDVAGMLISLQANYRSISIKSGEARFCGYVLQNSQNGVFRQPLTKSAEVIGISYRQLQRIVHSLCDKGLLQKQHSGYLVTDSEELLARARGD